MIDLPFIIATSGTISVYSLLILLVSCISLVIIFTLCSSKVNIGKIEMHGSISSFCDPFIEAKRVGWLLLIIPLVLIEHFSAYIFTTSFCLWFALSYLV